MIDRTNVTQQVVAYMTRQINEGHWKVGEKIPSENQLTQELGVSRASIRAAIQNLTGIGVLHSEHGRGTFLLEGHVDPDSDLKERITAEDCQDIFQVLQFRLVVECAAARLAAQTRDPGMLEKLRKSYESMKKNRGNQEAFVRQDLQFHKIIAHYCGNVLLEKSLNRVFRESYRNLSQMNTLFGYEDGILYHARILKAMEEGNAGEAEKQMREHMVNGITRIPQEDPQKQTKTERRN